MALNNNLETLNESATISIVIPVFNEVAFIEEILNRIQSVPIQKELIIVDDFSTDGTRNKLKKLEDLDQITILYHKRNRGKGAALRTGFKAASGGIVLIQDADF